MSKKRKTPPLTPKPPLFERIKAFVKRYLVAIGTVATALAILPYLASTYGWFKNINTVKLPDAFPNETWRDASVKKYAWLEGEWFYPSLPGYYSSFKIENEQLFQQDQGLNPEDFKTEWIKVKVFVSDKNVLRLRYIENDRPGTYITKLEGKKFEFYKNDRYVSDDGSVTAGDKNLALNKARCKVSNNGMTYNCD